MRTNKGVTVKATPSSHRDACIYQARVYLQQARAFRLRRAAENDGEAMSMCESGWFFDLMEFAAYRRASAENIPGRWWRCPGGLIFTATGGYNGVIVCNVPCFRVNDAYLRDHWYGVNSFTVRLEKLRGFLDRCEPLGDKEPTGMLRAQVVRLEGSHRWDRLSFARPHDDEEQKESEQLELFA